MATPKRKATDAPGNQQTTVKRSVLSSPSNKERQQHVLSWFDKEDIELQVSRQIEKIKIQEVIQNIDNVTYYRDLEVAFGTFGTVEQQNAFLHGEATHGSKCHHCGEIGHWKNTCTLTCNQKRCKKNDGQCAQGWHRGEQIKLFGTKHQGETFLHIAMSDPEYLSWVMQQWEPALDIFNLQQWGKERNVMYKKKGDFWDDLKESPISFPTKPLTLDAVKHMDLKKQKAYTGEFNQQIVKRITILNAKNAEKQNQNQKETTEEEEDSCDTDQECPLYCNETL